MNGYNLIKKEKKAAKGSTLVELCIVMALISIVATMIASFSVLAITYVNRNQAQYTFIEESSKIRSDIADWLAEADAPDAGISVSENALVFSSDVSVSFSQGAKAITLGYKNGQRDIQELESVESVKFSLDETNRVLKCSVFGTDGHGEVFKRTFAFTLRVFSFVEEGANA